MNNTSPSKLLTVLSRRGFFGRAAAAGGAVLLGSIVSDEVWAAEGAPCASPGLCNFPLPIPHINVPPPGGGHFYFPGPVSGAAAPTDPSGEHPEGRDPSVIFNFKGFVGQGDFILTGKGIDLTTGQTEPYQFHTDMRVMSGVFVGTDEVERSGSFAFV